MGSHSSHIGRLIQIIYFFSSCEDGRLLSMMFVFAERYAVRCFPSLLRFISQYVSPRKLRM